MKKILESENITKILYIGHEVQIFSESDKSNKSVENKDLTNLSPQCPVTGLMPREGSVFS